MQIHEFWTQRRVEFADTDLAGIVHFSRFFVFMETAEHELLRSLGAAIHSPIDGRVIGWPRLEASCEYLSPARFGDLISIHIAITRKGTKSISYAFTLSIGDRRIARGRITAVCCVMLDDALTSIPIPAAIADRLRTAPIEDGTPPIEDGTPPS